MTEQPPESQDPAGSGETRQAPTEAAPVETPSAAPVGESAGAEPPSENSSAEGAEAAPKGEASNAEGGDGKPRKRRRRRRGKGERGQGEGAGSKDAGGAPPAKKRAKGRPEGGGRRRGREGGREGGRGQGSQHHAMTAVRALSAMAEGLLEVEGIDFLSKPRFMDIELRIPLDAKRDGAQAASQVIEKILRRVKEVRDNDRALVPGAVYSYYTESAESEACRPTEVRHVFDGYGSTGRPNFTDFVTMAIERKDDGIDDLLAGEDLVITHVTTGRVLRTAQLAEFGKQSPVYRVLGQVDAGLFPLVNSSKKAAFSFQVLRGSTLEGKPRLRVNPVGAADVLDLADPSVANLLSRFQRKLDTESLRLSGLLANDSEVDEEEFILPLLQELAKQLAGRARRKNRRTKHADQRSEEGRPTAKAFEDAQAADDERLFWDDRENTVVVLGPRGRVHVFSASAKHVTSLVMQGAAISKRKQQGQWRSAEPEERGEFRMALKRRIGQGDTAVDGDDVAAATD